MPLDFETTQWQASALTAGKSSMVDFPRRREVISGVSSRVPREISRYAERKCAPRLSTAERTLGILNDDCDYF